MAQDLAQHYGGACLSVDNVVTDALLNGSSAVSLRARQLYNAAASQYSDKKSREPGKHKIWNACTAAMWLLIHSFIDLVSLHQGFSTFFKSHAH